MIDDERLRVWFFREVFPHEAMLTRLIRRYWRRTDEIRDIRQEIYARIYAAARNELPMQARPFLLAIARNHLLNELKRSQIVPIDFATELDIASLVDDVTPERHATARDELRRVQSGIERLPSRCREVVRMRRIEGLSTREVADRLSITPRTVEHQLMLGTRALVDFMLGGSGRINRSGGATDDMAEAER